MKMKMNYQKLIKTISNLFVKESNDFNEKTNIKKFVKSELLIA